MSESSATETNSESVSRRKFIGKIATVATATGVGLTAADYFLRVPQKVNAVTDQFVRVDNSDTTADFLNPKISVGTGISKSILNPGGNEQLQIAISSSSLVSPYRQLVWRDSTTSYVKDGTTGSVTTYTSSTRDSDALNAALNALTSGRTWKERVVVVGGLVGIAANISLPSYATLDLTGALLKVQNSANLSTGILTVSTNATNVEILGGVIDGNRTNQTANGSHGILLLGGTSKVKIIGTKITNTYHSFGTYLAGNTSDVLLQDLTIDGTDGSAIASDSSNPGDNTNVRIIRPIITNYSDRVVTGFGGAFDAIHTEGTSGYVNRRWLIEGADIDGTGSQVNGHGIDVGTLVEGRIIGCKTFKARLNGLAIISSNYVKAFGNHFESSGQGGLAGYQNGIQVDDTGQTPASTYCSCTHNTLINNIGYAAIEKGTADHNAFSDNLLTGNGNGISKSGSNSQ